MLSWKKTPCKTAESIMPPPVNSQVLESKDVMKRGVQTQHTVTFVSATVPASCYSCVQPCSNAAACCVCGDGIMLMLLMCCLRALVMAFVRLQHPKHMPLNNPKVPLRLALLLKWLPMGKSTGVWAKPPPAQACWQAVELSEVCALL